MATNKELLKISKNPYYAKLLKNLFDSSFGEVFLHLQLAYFSSVLCDFENDFYSLFKTMSNDDFLHQQKLANLIKIVGDNPEYNCFKKPCNFSYFKSVKEIIFYSLELKEKIIIEYKIILKKITNECLQKELQIILCDEEKHRQILKNIVEKLEK